MPGTEQDLTLRFSVDFSHHLWTRPAARESAPDMHRAARHTLDMIAAADEAGLESAWLSEDPDGWDAMAVLGAVSNTTSRIRLGPGVTNPYLRHPNLIAMSISTIDRMSGGRAFLGLGRGQSEWYRDALGVQTPPALETLEATIQLLRQWWRSPYRASSMSGYAVRDWARAIEPIQQPPPIYLAAVGPKAVSLAARLCDGLLVADFASIPFLERFVPELLRQVEDYGRSAEEFRVFVRTGIQVTEQVEDILHYRKALMALLTPLPGMSRQIEHPDFDIERIVHELRSIMKTDEVLQRGGNFIDIRNGADYRAARRVIPNELIEELSYAGSAAGVREKLLRLQRAGVTDVFLSPPPVADPEAFRSQIQALQASREQFS